MRSSLLNAKYTRLNVIVLAFVFWIIFILLLFLGGGFIPKLFPDNWERFIYGIVGTGAAVLVTSISLKLEKKSFRDIGLVWERRTMWRFLLGLVYGTFIMVFILSGLLAFTELQIERNKIDISIWQILFYLTIIPLALMEEIAFRSYPFIKLNQAFGLRFTLVIVSIAFALYHVVTGWDIYIAFWGPGIWAFVFGLSAAKSGGIAVPTGIHVALNVLQPLTGMKSGNFASVWTLNYREGTPDKLISRTDTVGLIIQLSILIFSVILTEIYLRKRAHNRKI